MRRRDRGITLVVAMGFVLVVALLLGAAAQAYRRVSEAHREGLAEEAALAEARAGVRWMAARLGSGDASPLERTDAFGTLKVEAAGDRIVAAFRDGGRTLRVSARWRKGQGLDDWRDE